MNRIERRAGEPPYFSICIPQYNRTSFLLAALHSIEQQDFRAFEICISDDVSNDGREQEVLDYLEQSGMHYAWVRQTRNLRYDGNLRAAISLANGRYCFLLGNDDGLADRNVLRSLASLLVKNKEPGVALTNYCDAESHNVYRRVLKTGIAGSGAETAVRNFRNFSFVSGVLIRRDLAHAYATREYDGSEMYQVYLVTRALAEGNELLNVSDVAIDKDLRIPNESVDSYAAKARLDPCPIVPRQFNLARFPGVVAGGLSHGVEPAELRRLNNQVLQQLYAYTYPYWLVEFRRVQSWKYALGIALGQRPAVMMKGLDLDAADRLKIRTRWLWATIAGLLAPVKFTQRWIAPIFYRAAKRAPAQ